MFARHVFQLEGASSLSNLIEVKDWRSARQGRHREVGADGSASAKLRPDEQESDSRQCKWDELDERNEVLHPSKACAVNPPVAW